MARLSTYFILMFNKVIYIIYFIFGHATTFVFNYSSSYEFGFFGNFTLENVKNVQKFQFRAAQVVKIAVFKASK